MKKIVAVYLILIVCFFTGCLKLDNNAVIVQDGVTCRQEWFEENYTRGSYQSEYDKELPEDRTYRIDSQDELDEIFSDFPKIDFEREMVVVYCYTTTYIREQKLEKASLKNGVLYIEFNVVQGMFGHGDATAPQTRLCVIRVDKTEVFEVEITYNGQ